MGMAKEPCVWPILNEKITHVGVESGGKCVDLAGDSQMGTVMCDNDCFAVWSGRMLARQTTCEPSAMVLMNAEGFSWPQPAFQSHNWDGGFGYVGV